MKPERHDGAFDHLLAGAVALAAAVLAAGWASLALACLIAGRPAPGLAAAASAIGGWAANPAAPAARLAAPAPSAALVYAVLILVLGAAVGLACGGRAAMTARTGGGSAAGRTQRGARWARRTDLAEATIRGPEPGRIVLGRTPGGLLASRLGESVLVVGPPRSGKSAGIVVPALLEWEGPVICTSVKTDLLDATYARRSQLGRVLIFDPTLTTRYERAGWDPIASCATWSQARKLAVRLALPARPGPGPGGEMDFWRRTAVKLITPMFLAAHLSGRAMSDVLRWIDTEERDEIDDALRLAHPDVRAAAEANWKRDPRQLSSIYTTAETILEAFADERVAQTTTSHDISPERLLDGPNTLYLVAPADEQETLRPVFATLIAELLSEIYARCTRTGKPADPRVLVLLDELANVAPLGDLDGLATTGGGQGVQLVSVIHSLAQLTDRYGADRAANIASSHAAKVYLSGLSDERTLTWAKTLAGDQEVNQLSHTTADRGPSRTHSTTWRPLAPGHVVREQPRDGALVIYANHKPIRARLRLWFTDTRLRRLAEEPPSPVVAADPRRRNRTRWI